MSIGLAGSWIKSKPEVKPRYHYRMLVSKRCHNHFIKYLSQSKCFFFNVLLQWQEFSNTVIHHVMMRIFSERCVIRWYCHLEHTIEYFHKEGYSSNKWYTLIRLQLYIWFITDWKIVTWFMALYQTFSTWNRDSSNSEWETKNYEL